MYHRRSLPSPSFLAPWKPRFVPSLQHVYEALYTRLVTEPCNLPYPDAPGVDWQLAFCVGDEQHYITAYAHDDCCTVLDYDFERGVWKPVHYVLGHFEELNERLRQPGDLKKAQRTVAALVETFVSTLGPTDMKVEHSNAYPELEMGTDKLSLYLGNLGKLHVKLYSQSTAEDCASDHAYFCLADCRDPPDGCEVRAAVFHNLDATVQDTLFSSLRLRSLRSFAITTLSTQTDVVPRAVQTFLEVVLQSMTTEHLLNVYKRVDGTVVELEMPLEFRRCLRLPDSSCVVLCVGAGDHRECNRAWVSYHRMEPHSWYPGLMSGVSFVGEVVLGIRGWDNLVLEVMHEVMQLADCVCRPYMLRAPKRHLE